MNDSVREGAGSRVLVLALLLMFCGALHGPSYAQSIDELERRIEAAKKAEADKASAAERVRKKREEQTRSSEEQQRNAEPKKLVVPRAVEGSRNSQDVQVAESRLRAQDAKRNIGITDLGGGMLKDGRTGLVWTQNDSGSDINWNTARSYCAAKGGDWRLPTVDELLAIYDENATPVTCWSSNERSQECKTSPLFRLTGFGYWSVSLNGSTEAWLVYLGSGSRYSYPVGRAAIGRRALCVRVP